MYVNRIWTIDSAAARGRRKSFVVSSYMDTSIVANCGPPKINTTPKLVNENAKANTADEQMAGKSKGNVTWMNLFSWLAPKVWAVSVKCVCIFDQNPETMRTTTA